jgi:hypothetical protein
VELLKGPRGISPGIEPGLWVVDVANLSFLLSSYTGQETIVQNINLDEHWQDFSNMCPIE